jgi:DNA-binding PadR family transcriptional regulator
MSTEEGSVAPGEFPGELEQMVLLAILRLEGDAHALAVLRELDDEAGRRVSRGTLYKTLDRMEAKGWVAWTVEETTPERGGHPRRLFRVTPGGVERLRSSREALLRLWSGLEPLLKARRS